MERSLSGKSLQGSGVAERSEAEPLPDVLSTEVASRQLRRKFSATFKQRIVKEAERYKESRELGAFLRREGVYSSQLTQWRKQLVEGGLAALSQNRGRKPKEVNPLDKKVRELEVKNRKLQKQLAQAEAIIDIQKKVAAILNLGNDESGNSL